MKVVFVNQPMDMLVPPHQNSIGIWTYKTAPHVAESHDVLVLGKRSAAQREWTGDDGVTYEFVRPLAPNRRIISGRDSLVERVRGRAARLPSYASRVAYLDYAGQVALRARRFGAEVIHIHNFTQFVPTVRTLNPTARIVLHMNCEWASQHDFEVMDERLAATDLVLGSSDYITDRIARRFSHHAGKCATMYNGVDVDRFTAGDADPGEGDGIRRLLFVGRVSPEKGVHDLIDAFVRVAREVPEVRLDLAGPVETLPKEFILDVSEDPEVADLARFYEGEYADHLRARIPDDLRDRVSFLGGLPQDELRAHYRAADLLINPSYSESFGMSLVEAGACERPVVATRIGGMVEIVGDDEEVGVLVDRGDVPALADAVTRLLRDDATRARMGAAGRRRVVDRFSWSQIGASLVSHYERIVAHPVTV